MAGEFNNYVLQQRPIQPLLDLGVVQNTLATITAGNKEALQKTSELKTAIANLDLNEAEDGYKEGLYNEIEKTIDDNAIEGNAYYALDDIIKKQGDIASNPGLLGRVNAQKAYKDFQAQLDTRVQRGDISVDTAEWAKAQNPYHYADKYKLGPNGMPIVDASGKPIVIGGTEWKPDIVPVKDIDFNEVFDAVAKQLKPKTSSWSGKPTFLYDNGEKGNEFKPGSVVGVFSESTGSYIKLEEQTIKEAINNAFQNNPALAAQAKQSWDVLNWKADNGKITPSDENGAYNGSGGLFNVNGSRKSYNQYLEDMVDEYARIHAYNNTTSEVKYHDATINKQYDLLHQVGKYKSGSGSGSGIESSFSGVDLSGGAKKGLYEIQNSQYDQLRTDTVIGYNTQLARVAQALNNVGINIPDGVGKTPEELFNFITSSTASKGLTPEATNAIYDRYLQYKDYYDLHRGELERLAQDNSANGSAKSARQDIMSRLQSGRSLDDLASSNNPLVQQYMQDYAHLVDTAFNKYNVVGFSFNKQSDLDNYIAANGGRKKLEDAGYVISGNNISIDKNHSHLLYDLTKTVQPYKGDYWRPTTEDGDGSTGKQNFTGGFLWNYAQHSQGGSPTAGIPDSYSYTQNNNPTFTRKAFERNFTNFSTTLADNERKEQTRLNEAKGERGNRSIMMETAYRQGATIEGIQALSLLEITGEAKYKNMYDASKTRFEEFKNGDHNEETLRVHNGDSAGVITDMGIKKSILDEIKALGRSETDLYEPYIDIIPGLGIRSGVTYSYQSVLDAKDKKRLEDEGAIVVKLKDAENRNTYRVSRDIIFDDYSWNQDMVNLNNSSNVRNSNRVISNYLEGNNQYIGYFGNTSISAAPNTEDPNAPWTIQYDGSDGNITLNHNDLFKLNLLYEDIVNYRNFYRTQIDALNTPEEKEQALQALTIKLIQDNPESFGIISSIVPGNDGFYKYVLSNLTH